MNATHPNVDQTTILELARLATGCSTLQIGSWKTTTLSVQGRRSNFRFAGIGKDGTKPRPWSFVLKQIQSPENPNAPDAGIHHCAYWEREYLLYKAGIPQTLSGELRAPYCFGTAQPSLDLRWIWLEDLHDFYNWEWPIEHYAKTAYHLGRFNGQYLVGKFMPIGEYLAKNALRCGCGYHIADFDRYRDPSMWKHPLVRRAYPEPVIEKLDQLAADQDRLLSIVESFPQTFCHLDAWHGNMAAVENADRTVSTALFDWALAGYGAPGEEIAPLIWSALLESYVDIQNAARLENEVFTQYLQGLEDAGFHPDPTQIRCAYFNQFHPVV